MPPIHKPPPVPVPNSERKIFHPSSTSQMRDGKIVLNTEFAHVQVGRPKNNRSKKPKKIKIDKSGTIESLAQPGEIKQFFNGAEITRLPSHGPDPMADLVKNANNLPPMPKDQIEAIYAAKINSNSKSSFMDSTNSMDFYGETFVEKNKAEMPSVQFKDPMANAYAKITDEAYRTAAGNIEPDVPEKNTLQDPVMARSESGKRTADFAFPETKIGRKGMPKREPIIEPLASLDSNLISLLPKATEDSGELKRQGRVTTRRVQAIWTVLKMVIVRKADGLLTQKF